MPCYVPHCKRRDRSATAKEVKFDYFCKRTNDIQEHIPQVEGLILGQFRLMHKWFSNMFLLI
jgi:hypothetical protein